MEEIPSIASKKRIAIFDHLIIGDNNKWITYHNEKYKNHEQGMVKPGLLSQHVMLGLEENRPLRSTCNGQLLAVGQT